MAIRKQRATTQMNYSVDTDYNKVLKQAKKLYRNEGVFYIGTVLSSYTSYSENDLKIHPETKVNEKWNFKSNRWVKKELEGLE